MSHTYSEDLKMVKQAANVPEDVDSFDQELGTMLLKAYNWMNNMLIRYTTAPLTGTIPEIIKECEADIAAGYFKEQKTTPVEGERIRKHLLRERGEQCLLDYIETTFTSTSPINRANAFRHNKENRRLNISGTDEDVT